VIESGTHSLTIDTLGALKQATTHLLDHGYEDIALINVPADWPISREAFRGFQQAFKERNLNINKELLFSVPNFGYDAGRFVIKRMLNEGLSPRAIVTVSDNLAIGAISELRKNGLQVPQDVAIIGFNDIVASSIIDPPLTSVALPLFEMGQETMLVLNTVLNGGVCKWIHQVFSGNLAIRDSCGCKNLNGVKGEKS
jgi:DNA-binding LacI/PurR family transcriptional regulator